MTDVQKPSITLDLKKKRIRIHKHTLQQLNNPQYIQLLVNPSDKIVAIKSANQALSSDSVHKISGHTMKSSNSIEIYSSFFIDQLLKAAEVIPSSSLLRLTGAVYKSEKAAVFPLNTLEQV